jgi:hypothetical protein
MLYANVYNMAHCHHVMLVNLTPNRCEVALEAVVNSQFLDLLADSNLS